MPILKSIYKAPFLYSNAHVATVLPSIYRQVVIEYTRERINTPDDDFLDLDWVKKGSNKVVIVSHGLEGHSKRHYVSGTAKKFSEDGWDVVAWNCRSCSGEMNSKPRLYSHIDAPDLSCVIDHVLHGGNYNKITLVGFSMGGAITLNYLTKMKSHHPKELTAAVAISAPVDVGGSADELEKRKNHFYLMRFMKKMISRVKLKAEQFPDLLDLNGVDDIKTFTEYDVRFTAPLNGCKDPTEFYQKASTLSVLKDLEIPTLLLIARDDPFMPKSCYPYSIAEGHKYLHLEVPKNGGHVGFTQKLLADSWMEGRALEFIANYL